MEERGACPTIGCGVEIDRLDQMHLRQEVQERSTLHEACSKIRLFKQVQYVEDCQIDYLSNCCYEAQAKPSNATIVFKAAVPYLWKRMGAAYKKRWNK